MAEPGAGDQDQAARDPGDAQAHITVFWNMVAPGYEAHGGNVTEYGSAEYQPYLITATRP